MFTIIILVILFIFIIAIAVSMYLYYRKHSNHEETKLESTLLDNGIPFISKIMGNNIYG
jgi:flagellar basal body-associated protein FliL